MKSSVNDPSAVAPFDLGNLSESAPADSGLVISPITDTPDFSDFVVPQLIRFPSAEMVSTAAAMFPALPREQSRTTMRHMAIPGGGGSMEYTSANEGPRARIEIGPGILRLSRVDWARAARTADRARLDTSSSILNPSREDWPSASPAQDAAEEDFTVFDAMVEGALQMHRDSCTQAVQRGNVTLWSRDSRARLVSTIVSLDLALFVAQGTPCMVTLTLPGDWLAVAPDAATVQRAFQRFFMLWRKRWGSSIQCIWKREFQDRGAPHWHLWLVPPVAPRDMKSFRDWLSHAWTTALRVSPLLGPGHFTNKPGYRCVCSEWCRSISAGTGVDFAKGIKAGDPKRLAIYFLKESLGGDGKEYQNGPPPIWGEEWYCDLATKKEVRVAGPSVGRFWGVRGLKTATVTVELSDADAEKIWRVMRRLRASKRVTRQVLVQRVNMKTGVIRMRKVRRRSAAGGRAGWIAVNDGAATGAALGRYASSLADDFEALRPF